VLYEQGTEVIYKFPNSGTIENCTVVSHSIDDPRTVVVRVGGEDVQIQRTKLKFRIKSGKRYRDAEERAMDQIKDLLISPQARADEIVVIY
jgi:hypothetical protein